MSRSLRMALSETEHPGIRLAGPVPIRDLVVVIRDVQIDQSKVERPLSGYLRIVDAEVLARVQSVAVQRSSPIAFGRPRLFPAMTTTLGLDGTRRARSG